jgi:hypothetical protein
MRCPFVGFELLLVGPARAWIARVVGINRGVKQFRCIENLTNWFEQASPRRPEFDSEFGTHFGRPKTGRDRSRAFARGAELILIPIAGS